jgi:membrane-associated protein
LFAVGALAANDQSGINIAVVTGVLIVAAILGDSVNYKIGQVFGERAFAGQYKFISQKHLLRTKDFYDRYGRRAIVIARFAPILRTFAPFVAGVGKMPYRRFIVSNVGGGIAWVGLFCGAGFVFGNQPVIKRNFHLVVIAIIVISLIPAVVEVVRARSEGRTTA